MKKKRVAFFSRVSTLEQHSSIENQQKIFEQWLERNPNCIFYKTYEDEGISGAKGYKRVEWLNMLEDGKKGLYDIILCKSFSRFGRNQTETLSAIKELRANGIRVVFLEDNLDSEIDNSKFGLFAWLAEEEAQKTSQRIKMVWDSFNKEGKIHVTIAPYGYDYDKELKNFVVNEKEKEVVENIFNLYLEGNGFNKIAQMLTDNNIKTKKGGKWAGATIRTILTNEFYLGILIQGKTRTLDATMKENKKIDESEWYKHEDNHEALISEEVFRKVNEQIQERSLRAKETYTKEHSNCKRNSNRSLFSNLLICGECNNSMVIKRKKRSNYKPHYQCLVYDRISLKCGHKSNRINEDILTEILKEELILLSEDNFKRLRDIKSSKSKKKDKTKIEKEKKALEKKREDDINIANNLVMLLSRSIITQSQFELQNASIVKSLDSIAKRLKEIDEELKEDTTENKEEEIFLGIESILNKSIKDWTNSELKEVVESITVFIDGAVKVKIRYFD